MGSDSNLRPRPIPEASLRRLPVYYHLLREMQAACVSYVSCSAIARDLGLDATQVRKDIEMTGIIGKPKVGYPLLDLLARIDEFLGWNRPKGAFLVGVGSLGSALLGYEKFRNHGVNIVAAFDTDSSKIGVIVHGKEIQPLGFLPDLARCMDVHLGVIATPAAAAQSAADLMVRADIRAIWNFAPVHLRVPDSIILQNEDLYHSLASLSFKLECKMRGNQESEAHHVEDH